MRDYRNSGNWNLLKSILSRCFSISTMDKLPTISVQFRSFLSSSSGSLRMSVSPQIFACTEPFFITSMTHIYITNDCKIIDDFIIDAIIDYLKKIYLFYSLMPLLCAMEPRADQLFIIIMVNCSTHTHHTHWNFKMQMLHYFSLFTAPHIESIWRNAEQRANAMCDVLAPFLFFAELLFTSFHLYTLHRSNTRLCIVSETILNLCRCDFKQTTTTKKNNKRDGTNCQKMTSFDSFTQTIFVPNFFVIYYFSQSCN